MKRLWLAILVVLGGFFGGIALAQGVTLHIQCGAVGKEGQFCKDEVAAWAKQTGNTVVVVSRPNSTSDTLALYQQQLAGQSSSVDVYQLDVTYPGLIGGYFIDLSKYFSKADFSGYIPGYMQVDNYQGKQIAVPWFGDAGILFYRTDLLKKYGYDHPPTTWTELTQMAQKIQAGERAAGNDKFWGYVWQGNSYEGLTCDALEWIYSYGGGTIVDPQGNITIDNPKAAQALQMAAGWVGTISPPGVLSYQEEEARGVWQAGNAAFMRNWSYAYPLGNSADSPIKGEFAVTAVPKADTPDGQHAATLGGWQLGVSRFSQHPAEAAALVKYLTSPEVMTERAVKGGYLPGRLSVYDDPAVAKAQPYMPSLKAVFEGAVPRPTTATKTKYNQVSSAFWTAVHNVLAGQAQANQALAGLKEQLTRIKGTGW